MIALTFALIPYLGAISEGRKIGFWSLAVSSFLRFFLWGILFPFIFRITGRFGFGSRQNFLRSFFLHLVLGVFFSILHFTAYASVSWLLEPAFQERYPVLLKYLLASIPGSLTLGLPFYALIVFASQAYHSRVHLAAEEKKASQLQAELVQAQLQALKMQLQPHFLFNTLNSISSLVLTNPAKAHAMIARLGDFLRLTLDYNEDQMVLLREELRFLRSYLEIEQTRFSDRLQVEFDVENDILSAVVPHLILQPVVENSIKHAIARRSAGGVIRIKAGRSEDKLCLQIQDSGAGITPKTEKTNNAENSGKGLANIQSRLKHLYGNNFSFSMNNDGDSGEMTVTFILPLNFDFTSVGKGEIKHD
ncbi:MAG TPA: histidine kinase [Pyrinomonadaceae bacterium]